jgi:hypothetical protein
MRDRGSHKTKRASYIEESWAIVYRNAVIRSGLFHRAMWKMSGGALEGPYVWP